MELYAYKTINTLLLSTRETRNVDTPRPSMVDGKIIVERFPVKDCSRTHLKLSVFNGKLFVVAGTATDNFGSRHSRSVFSEFFHPSLGGVLVRYISTEMVTEIEGFLDFHFPETKDVDYDGLTPVYDIEDLPTFDQKMTEEQTVQVCSIALRITMTAFPIASQFTQYCLSDGFYKLSTKADLLYPYHRSGTYRNFLEKLFGFYRKDLSKAVMNHAMDGIEWVANFSGFVPDDFLIDTLRGVEKSKAYADVSANLDFHLLKRFSQKTIKNLIVDGLTNLDVDTFQVRDALEMSVNIPVEEGKSIKTWKELHDLGIGNFRLKITNESSEIEFTETFTGLFTDLESQYCIQPLKNAKDFVFVGDKMKLCVGSMSYVNRAYNGDGVYFLMSNQDTESLVQSADSVLVEITKEATTGFNVNNNREVDSWNVSQVYGYGNSSTNSSFYKKIVVETLKKHLPSNMSLTNR